VSVWAWFSYHLLLAVEIQIVAGLLGTVALCMPLLLIGNTSVQIKLLQQSSIAHDIRIDFANVAHSVLQEVLAKHIPGYQALGRHLDVGEELLRHVKQRTDRSVDFERMLSAAYPGMALSEAIDEVVKQSAKEAGIETDVERLTDFMESKPAKGIH
jgi:hypothetical protein